MKTKFKSTLRAARDSFSGAVFAGVVLLITSSAQAQNLFVADYASGNIYEFTPGGAQSTFASGLGGPFGLAFNSAGDLFVADESSGDITEITPGGVQNTFASGLFDPFGLAVNSTGNLFVASPLTGNIYEFTPGGAQSTFASGLSPNGLAFNNTGDLFVANGGNSGPGNIIEIAPNGTQSTFASGFTLPLYGLAFNSAGDLFVGDTGGNIYEFTPGGVRSTFASGLHEPVGLAFNSAGDLFASEESIGNITKITPGGVRSTFASGLDVPGGGLAFQPVPEPSALGLLAVGATALLVRRRRNLAADLNPNQKPSVPSNRNFRVIPRRLLAGLTVLVGCALAHGSTVSIVAPNGLTGTEGNIANIFPFSVAETIRYQQVYTASQFGAIAAGGGMITGIAFRPDAVYGNAFTHTIANIRIDLATTMAGPGGLSLTFANNVGANDTTVFNGSLTLSSTFTGPAGGPKNFDILIPLTTPFYYNPAAGNLLLDIRNFSSGNSGGNLISILDATSANPTLVGRVYTFDASAPNSFDEDTWGLVTQFTATPVPEPATWGLLCVAALLVGRRGIAKA
jgi:sugar lactone lactonase YvrE